MVVRPNTPQQKKDTLGKTFKKENMTTESAAAGAHHTTITISGRETRVRDVMGQVRRHKRYAARTNQKWSFDIHSDCINGIATAVMAAGLLGDAKDYKIENTTNNDNNNNKKTTTTTSVTFSFDEESPCLVGNKADYERLKADEECGAAPGCWYISGLRNDRTLSTSIAAFSARAHKSVEDNTKMHLGSAGSASRVLFVMVAKAIERKTHTVENLTVHNDKVVLADGAERDMTFVHAVLVPSSGC